MFIQHKADKRSLSFRRPIYGVGINDAWYKTAYWDNGKKFKCKYYSAWFSMLVRCYQPKYLNVNPTYRECTVCDEWLSFSSFREWMKDQDSEGMELDKDIKALGNKVYSPDSCIFIPHDLNSILGTRGSKYSIVYGVSKRGGSFVARCQHHEGRKHIGTFSNRRDAEVAYVKFKCKYILSLMDKYSHLSFSCHIEKIALDIAERSGVDLD